MITTDARVENVARAMCRAAGFDPDQEIPPDAPHYPFASMQPEPTRVFAWRRFVRAAENYCALSHDLAEPDRTPSR